MRLGNYNIRNVTSEYSHDNCSFYACHKYWYLWEVFIDFFFVHLYIEICRTDWNRSYKNSCKNYTSKCEHDMTCNECKECFNKINVENDGSKTIS